MLPLGQWCTVQGRRVWLHPAGAGGPGVVFLPGAGLVGLDFLNIHERVAEVTTSVLYDRAGTGWSAPVEMPRSAGEVVEELEDVLRVAGVRGPFVLVGHSLGTFYARRFAQRFPDQIAGLVLLDPGHEDVMSFMPEAMTELNERMKPDLDQMPDLTSEQLDASRAALEQLYEQWPDSVREPLVAYHLAEWRIGVEETANFETDVYDELRHGGPLPAVPMIVLSAMGSNPYWAQFMTEQQMREGLDGIRSMHAMLAGSVPDGEHRLVEGASHQYLHIERPEDVLASILDVLARIGSSRDDRAHDTRRPTK